MPNIKIIFALMIRERLTRYAGGRLGPAWALLTPLAWIAFVVILFRVLDRVPAINVTPEIFVATGVLPYISFRQAVSSMARAYPAHRYMRYLQPVSINDILLATILLEALNMFAAALVIFGVISFVFDVPLPDDPAVVLFGFALAWLIAGGLGRLVAILGMISDSFARSVPILLRPLFWVSGIFYTATELPSAVSDVLWYSPLLHVTEIIRSGYFAVYTSPLADPIYPITVAAVLFVMSAVIELNFLGRHRVGFRI